MSDAVIEFEKLATQHAGLDDIVAGQMFGKACLKIKGKAFIAQQNAYVVFKLSGEPHATALRTEGAVLWDPSGKGRPMKEWVALPVSARARFDALAAAAMAYVAQSA